MSPSYGAEQPNPTTAMCLCLNVSRSSAVEYRELLGGVVVYHVV